MQVLNDKSDDICGYFLCVFSICLLTFSILVIDIMAMAGSISALLLGILGLRISHKARKRLKEDLQRLEQKRLSL